MSGEVFRSELDDVVSGERQPSPAEYRAIVEADLEAARRADVDIFSKPDTGGDPYAVSALSAEDRRTWGHKDFFDLFDTSKEDRLWLMSRYQRTLDRRAQGNVSAASRTSSPPMGVIEREQLEYERIVARDKAKDRRAAELAEAEPRQPFDIGTLGEILERPDDTAWRIDGLLHSEGTMNVIAQRKSGKTTLVLNLVRSLLLGRPFLGRFQVEPVDGKIAVLNYEVSGRLIAGWAAQHDIDPGRLILVNLRGRRNPLGHAGDRAELATLLRDAGVEVLIVDPFANAFTGENQNDNSQVARFFRDLELFARSEVGASELIVASHAGWGSAEEGQYRKAPRARGAGAQEDWPDSIVRLRRDDASGTRSLSAEGRDVDVPEDVLDYDEATRTYSMSGRGGLAKVAQADRLPSLVDDVVAYVEAHPGCSQRTLEDAISGKSADVRAAAKSADESGRIERRNEGRTITHWPLP